MGLTSINAKKENATFLTVASKYFLNKNIKEGHADYSETKYIIDGNEKVRKGGHYNDMICDITGVKFSSHDQWGEFIQVSVNAYGEPYIVSMGLNNKYSKSMMTYLLLGDMKKSVYMNPFDFEAKDGKRVQGISFKQNGQKINLRDLDMTETKFKENDEAWFKNASKKQIKRYYEDLSEWMVAEIEERIVPIFEKQKEVTQEKETIAEDVSETKTESKEVAVLTPLKMKKALRTYISENYEGEELPKDLKGEDLKKWYNLSLNDEELPFKNGVEEAEVVEDDLDDQLKEMLGEDLPF